MQKCLVLKAYNPFLISAVDIIIRTPESDNEWDQYFDLRWRILRKPWQQPRGSEKDELEEKSTHRIALLNEQVIATGRLHFIDRLEAQIRYMAVDKSYQRQGIGIQILDSLEQIAKQHNIKTISLNSRENAVDFYQANQYKVTGPAHTLYNQIKHSKMEKNLDE